jgi:hypothetical protein
VFSLRPPLPFGLLQNCHIAGHVCLVKKPPMPNELRSFAPSPSMLDLNCCESG